MNEVKKTDLHEKKDAPFKVFIRVRPFIPQELNNPEKPINILTSEDNLVLLIH